MPKSSVYTGILAEPDYGEDLLNDPNGSIRDDDLKRKTVALEVQIATKKRRLCGLCDAGSA